MFAWWKFITNRNGLSCNAGGSYGSVIWSTAPSLPGAAYKGAEDTLHIIVDTLSGTATGGKLCIWEVICDVDRCDADAVDCKYLAQSTVGQRY